MIAARAPTPSEVAGSCRAPTARFVGRLLAKARGGVLLSTMFVLMGANPSPTVFDELGPALGITGKSQVALAPAWVDVDLDGTPEPVWISYDGVQYLDLPHAGEPQLLTASGDKQSLKIASRLTLSLAMLDFDDDGVDDLISSGKSLVIHRITESGKLKADKFPLPSLPGVTVFDIAIGDINADGLPDVALALAVLAGERLVRRGYRDVVLMNLGHGRFEVHSIEPSREDFSNGLTFADMDGDRRPDLVESINYSLNVGASRILYNRTPPGARIPVFEPSEHAFDTGTHGMGAAIADLDQDGIVDIYNTSAGLDQLSMGQADGSFVDESYERGVFHLWGDAGLRSQWSPTFADMNLDGRLDIVVRQGGFGGDFGLQALGPGTSDTGKDVLYLQREDGTLVRDFPPYTPVSGSTGRHAVLGDVNDDGRPDVSLGGGGGSSNFWLNQTPVPEGGRVLTVRLKATVSASPAIGTRIDATCEDRTMTRYLTSGGKMGGHASSDVYFAWTQCQSDVSLTVRWTSGATTEHTVPPGETLATPLEPIWWSASAQGAEHVYVDPVAIDAAEICVRPAPLLEWVCCAAADGPCDIPLSEDLSARPIARVDDAEPVALMNRSSTWWIVSDPDPLQPGATADIHLFHIGDPARFHESEPSIFIGDPWAYQMNNKIDESRQVRSITVDVPEGIEELPVALFCDSKCPSVEHQYPQVTETLPVGGSLDPRWSQADAYPYRIIGGETEFWEWTGFVMGIYGVPKATFFEHTSVRRPDGSDVEYTSVQSTAELSRVRISVKWENILGVDTLTVVDGVSGQSFDLPVRSPYTVEEAVPLIESVGEGMIWHRLVTDGDLCPIAIELKDKDGYTLTPEEEMITLEATGAEIVEQPMLRSAAYDMFGLIRTDDCEADGGEVRVRAADGRLLSTHPFECRPQGLPELGLETSWVSLTPLEEVEDLNPQNEQHIAGATHLLRVHARNPHDESLGADTQVELHVTGGAVSGRRLLSAYGDIEIPIMAEPGAHPLTVETVVQGISLDTLTVDVDVPIPAQDVVAQDGGDAESPDLGPVPQDVSDDGGDQEPAGGGGGGGGGCGLADAATPSWWLALGVLCLMWRRRRVTP